MGNTNKTGRSMCHICISTASPVELAITTYCILLADSDTVAVLSCSKTEPIKHDKKTVML